MVKWWFNNGSIQSWLSNCASSFCFTESVCPTVNAFHKDRAARRDLSDVLKFVSTGEKCHAKSVSQECGPKSVMPEVSCESVLLTCFTQCHARSVLQKFHKIRLRKRCLTRLSFHFARVSYHECVTESV